jgi:uncharacterized protein
MAMDVTYGQVVLDTNVFVAARFNPRSHSARVLDAVRLGRLHMVWDSSTQEEVEHVLRQIPRLSWTSVAALFRAEDKFEGTTQPQKFSFVPDPVDRKFAALADAAWVPLVTSEGGLLMAAAQINVPALKPGEFQLLCELAP